jgi:hypothetical protein
MSGRDADAIFRVTAPDAMLQPAGVMSTGLASQLCTAVAGPMMHEDGANPEGASAHTGDGAIAAAMPDSASAELHTLAAAWAEPVSALLPSGAADAALQDLPASVSQCAEVPGVKDARPRALQGQLHGAERIHAAVPSVQTPLPSTALISARTAALHLASASGPSSGRTSANQSETAQSAGRADTDKAAQLADARRGGVPCFGGDNYGPRAPFDGPAASEQPPRLTSLSAGLVRLAQHGPCITAGDALLRSMQHAWPSEEPQPLLNAGSQQSACCGGEIARESQSRGVQKQVQFGATVDIPQALDHTETPASSMSGGHNEQSDRAAARWSRSRRPRRPALKSTRSQPFTYAASDPADVSRPGLYVTPSRRRRRSYGGRQLERAHAALGAAQEESSAWAMSVQEQDSSRRTPKVIIYTSFATHFELPCWPCGHATQQPTPCSGGTGRDCPECLRQCLL